MVPNTEQISGGNEATALAQILSPIQITLDILANFVNYLVSLNCR